MKKLILVLIAPVATGMVHAQCPHYITETGDNPVCVNDSLLLETVLGGSAYQWYRNGLPLPGQVDYFIYVNTAGAYNCIVDQPCGTDSAASTVFVSTNNIPVVSIVPSPDTAYCAGDSVLLTGSSGGASQWYLNGQPVAGATSYTLYASVPGVYNMTKTNTKGCADSAFAGTTVTENALPVVSLSPSPAADYCAGDSILLTGSSGGASQWYLNGQAIAGATSNSWYAATPGMYNMTKTNSKGCADSAATGTTVGVTAVPSALFAPDADTVNLAVSGQVTFTNSSLNATGFTWYFGDGDSSTVSGPTHTYDSAGTFLVTLVALNGICSDTAYDTVVVVNTTGLHSRGPDGLLMTIFPNPSSGVIELRAGEASSEVDVFIHDLYGRLVSQHSGTLPGRLDISMLPPSVYIVRVRQKDREATLRLVRQ